MIPLWLTVSGEWYTDTTTEVPALIDICDDGGYYLSEHVTSTPTKFVAHGCTSTMTHSGVINTQGYYFDFNYNTGTNLHVKNLKIETGYVEYPRWTPAYEDVESITDEEIDQLLAQLS